MKHSFPLFIVMCAVAGIALTGCAAKKTQVAGGADRSGATPADKSTAAPAKWEYKDAPTPPFDGTPEKFLTSFGFEEGASVLKSEAMGACQEAVKEIEGTPDARILAVGFADGIKEKDTAERLGTERAEAARRFLGTLGIASTRVHVASFGSRYSTARDFETIKQGHERKVELWVLK